RSLRGSPVQPETWLTVWTGDMVDTFTLFLWPGCGCWACGDVGEGAAGPRSGSSTYPQASRRPRRPVGPEAAHQAPGVPIDVAELERSVVQLPITADGLGDADGF